jgi:hypothetical protein
MSALLLALALTASGPAKLVIVFGTGGIAVTDYPSRARCEAARRSLLATIQQGKPTESGRLKFVYAIDAWCISG